MLSGPLPKETYNVSLALAGMVKLVARDFEHLWLKNDYNGDGVTHAAAVKLWFPDADKTKENWDSEAVQGDEVEGEQDTAAEESCSLNAGLKTKQAPSQISGRSLS